MTSSEGEEPPWTCADARAWLEEQGGFWLVSEFQEPAGGLRRLHARLWLRVMYSFFAITGSAQESDGPPGFIEVLQRHVPGATNGCDSRNCVTINVYGLPKGNPPARTVHI